MLPLAAGALPKEAAARHPRIALLADELRVVQHARQYHSVVYVMGRTHARLSKDAPMHQLPRRYLLELPFKARLASGSVFCRFMVYGWGLELLLQLLRHYLLELPFKARPACRVIYCQC